MNISWLVALLWTAPLLLLMGTTAIQVAAAMPCEGCDDSAATTNPPQSQDDYKSLAQYWAPRIYQDTDDSYYTGEYITKVSKQASRTMRGKAQALVGNGGVGSEFFSTRTHNPFFESGPSTCYYYTTTSSTVSHRSTLMATTTHSTIGKTWPISKLCQPTFIIV